MIPSLAERDIEEGLRSFLEREFPISTPGFRPGGLSILTRFLDERKHFLKGPWLEVRRPFRVDAASRMTDLLPHLCGEAGLHADMTPWSHQSKAWKRLAGDRPLSTLVATGTGSGKTECFLLPIMDAVLRMRDQGPGIKAIVIYPMNALATDQAKRFVKESFAVKENLEYWPTVGLYVGEQGKTDRMRDKASPINDREALRRCPPDILLTNYKMLDLLLLRREDEPLWTQTRKNKTLRYLVVDELHTFDGAQGTDLALLMRRLRDALSIGEEQLACVGTSATLGGDDSLRELQDYAQAVFGADFSSPECVITEDRLSPQETLQRLSENVDGPAIARWPSAVDLRRIREAGSRDEFLQAAVRAWFGEEAPQGEDLPVRLSRLLPRLEAFRELVLTEGSVLRLDSLAEAWRRRFPELRSFVLPDVEDVIRSLAALISVTRLCRPGTDKIDPFLQVRVQLWMRELSRLAATVEPVPRLLPSDSSEAVEAPMLPVAVCPVCGATAWITTASESDPDRISTALESIYDKWFDRHPACALLYPVVPAELERMQQEHPRELYELDARRKTLRPLSASRSSPRKPAQPENSEEDAQSVIVWRPKMTVNVSSERGAESKIDTKCPCCGAGRGSDRSILRILGAQAATLSSALIGRLHASPFSEDPRVIVFSDSVQDAAFRAGFLETRDHRTVRRQALALWIQEHPGASFFDLLCGLPDRWLGEKAPAGWLGKFGPKAEKLPAEKQTILKEAAFAATFLPRNLQTHGSWLNLQKRLNQCWNSSEQSSDELSAVLDFPNQESRDGWKPFVERVSARLRWDALLELSRNARTGRSLAREFSASVVPDRAAIRAAIPGMRRSIAELRRELARVPDEVLERYLTGLVLHMKTRRAFSPQDVPGWEDYLEQLRRGNFFSWEKYLGLSEEQFPSPVLMTEPDKATGIPFERIRRKEGWHCQWIRKVFGAVPLGLSEEAPEIVRFALEALAESGMVRFHEARAGTKNTRAAFLDPRRWRVEESLATVRCPRCGTEHLVPQEDAEFWPSLPCLNARCTGEGHELRSAGSRRARPVLAPVRVHAGEHTANVEDADRRAVERSFSEGAGPWDVNLISATPTLEMGIDIGSLSTVLLASMPPEKANYLQRIGRAGRRDGNALALTVCEATPHAQYFWESPEKMLEGSVASPGVYLRAVSVLERQLFAFTLSRWIRSVEDAAVPRPLSEVLRNAQGSGKPAASSFPRGCLQWIEAHAEKLTADFLAMLPKSSETKNSDTADEGPNAVASLKDSLRGFLSGKRAESERESLPVLMHRLFDRLLRERERISRRLESCREALKQIPADDPEPGVRRRREELLQLRGNLRNQGTSFGKRNTLVVLTDEGLLPNYAFPEEGIRMETSVLRSLLRIDDGTAEKDQGEDRDDVVRQIRLQRPAAPGLSELAPGSEFFAAGFVHHIDQIELDKTVSTDGGRRREEASGVRWRRFCPCCGFSAESASEEESGACLQCGSTQWCESKQRRLVAPLRSVSAYAVLRRDRISDAREKRSGAGGFERQTILEMPRGEPVRGWESRELSGLRWEYLPRAVFRDFNFGPAKKAGKGLQVAGRKNNAAGFTVCAHCGRLQDAGKGRGLHDPDCPFAQEKQRGTAQTFENLILSRTFQSEAVRIRVPLDLADPSVPADRVMGSFEAALLYGLRLRFRGSVSHLRVLPASADSGAAGDPNSRFLVLYDSVPGGTGYLKDLAGSPDVFFDVLRRALEGMTNCACAQDEKSDGCYRCLYSRNNARERSFVSRRCACRLLSRILTQADTFRSAGQSVAAASGPAVDSELEREFFQALGNRFRIQERSTGDRRLYLLQTGSGRLWELELQKDFPGPNASRPDFFFREARPAPGRAPRTMALFTDGWEYHADIVREDCVKRQALLLQGHRVWTLAWDDVRAELPEGALDGKHIPEPLPLCGPADSDSAGLLADLLPQYGEEHCLTLRKDAENPTAECLDVFRTFRMQSSFERLAAWLEDPEETERRARIFAFVRRMEMMLYQQVPAASPWAQVLGEYVLSSQAPDTDPLWNALSTSPEVPFRTVLCVDPAAFSRSSGTKQELRAFWAAASAYGLAEDILLLSCGEGHRPGERPFSAPLKDGTPPQERLLLWQDAETEESGPLSAKDTEPASEILELLDPELHALARELARRHVPLAPDQIGVEIEDPDTGAFRGTVAELFWLKERLAVVLGPGGEEFGITCLNGAQNPSELAGDIARRLSVGPAGASA